jgi:hypothetical protein
MQSLSDQSDEHVNRLPFYSEAPDIGLELMIPRQNNLQLWASRAHKRAVGLKINLQVVTAAQPT